MSRELPIPTPAKRDAASVEMVRAWIAEQGLHCSINIGIFADAVDEPRARGILLADLARHASNALRDSGSSPEVLGVIQRQFNDELANPTSRVTGRSIDDH